MKTLILDTCIINSIFDESCAMHNEFKPVKVFIQKGGKIIFGGSTYYEEIKKTKLIHLLTQFDKSRQLVRLSDGEVNKMEDELKNIVSDSCCDDFHIFAMYNKSNCEVICTSDDRMIRCVKKYKRELILRKLPRFYTKGKNKNLLI